MGRNVALYNTYQNDIYINTQVCECVFCVLSHVQVFATLWTAAHRAPLCMGFPRQEYWSGCHFPTQGLNLSGSAALHEDSLSLSHWESYIHK